MAQGREGVGRHIRPGPCAAGQRLVEPPVPARIGFSRFGDCLVEQLAIEGNPFLGHNLLRVPAAVSQHQQADPRQVACIHIQIG
ncbi:hypothetical protein D3C77_600670 [compost metagenome]